MIQAFVLEPVFENKYKTYLEYEAHLVETMHDENIESLLCVCMKNKKEAYKQPWHRDLWSKP